MAIVLVRFIARFIVNWSSTQCHSVHGSPAAVLPCRPVPPSPTRHTHVPHLCAYETVGAATEQDCRTFPPPPAVTEKPAGTLRRGRRARDNTPPSARSSNLSVLALLGAFLVPLIVAVHRSLTMPGLFDAADQYALLLSLLAGLATSVGGTIAVWKKPDQKLLAFLLGLAIGVMSCLSVVELYVKNVIENGFMGITLAMVAGAMTYVVLEPLLPKAEVLEAKVEPDVSDDAPRRCPGATMRLGLLMAITMTLHNLPEGFAVAFSLCRELLIQSWRLPSEHNVPEESSLPRLCMLPPGADAQRWRRHREAGSVGNLRGRCLRGASSNRYLTPATALSPRGNGGMMLAVCVVELFPSGPSVAHDAQPGRGTAAGAIVMLGTLHVV